MDHYPDRVGDYAKQTLASYLPRDREAVHLHQHFDLAHMATPALTKAQQFIPQYPPCPPF
ncbi:hypothetical protein HBH70_071260 [Parastagonospora nodorum]|nr:hypothetical protein HBH49_085500 [Parastagonospora nodorum]KAH4258993.1 hypothetical protein HBI03_140220 [Parastagonospora nodorum]KAH4276474.1 hypothetical protein HBI04_109200 [Parastagonospora nodorum]KAH4902947.1 hypothetical protein HBI80_125350 [Parastagonospora nodorum]KAH4969039.1 hypothetical protein HBI78_061660 [Parastagonospora nodorum]